MSRQLRIACILAVVALAAAWGLIHQQNEELQQRAAVEADS